MGKKFTDKQKEMMNYLFVRGMSQTAIAELLGFHLNTINLHADREARERYQEACVQRVREELGV